MKKIANIVSNVELVNHKKLEYINYLNYPFELNGLPTLFVGWNDLKKNRVNGHNLDILNKEIEKNQFYWEFSFDEKKSDHINGISLFANNAPFYYFSNYTYQLIDPIFNNINTIDDFNSIINQYNIEYAYQYKDEMIYLLDRNNVILGIDIKMFEYFNITEYYTNLPICESLHDSGGSTYDYVLSKFPFYQNQLKRNIVVLLAKSII